jgi:nicotinamidase-related amidase
MPFELPITVDADVFVARTRRTVNGVKYGWDSKRMDDVVAALRAYKIKGGSRDTLKSALYHWRTEKRTEFDNRDRISGGLVTKLCVEAGFDEWRNPPSPAVKLHGVLRLNPQTMVAAQVSLLPHSVAHELAQAVADGTRVPAVIIIDLYGNDLAAQGLNNSYGSGKPVLGHITDLLSETEKVPTYICCKNTTQSGQECTKHIRDAIAASHPKTIASTTNSVLDGSDLAVQLKLKRVTDAFVVGFDANICVAATIFGFQKIVKGENGLPKQSYGRGLLDLGINVITSRFVVGSGSKDLETGHGWPYMGAAG